MADDTAAAAAGVFVVDIVVVVERAERSGNVVFRIYL